MREKCGVRESVGLVGCMGDGERECEGEVWGEGVRECVGWGE